MFRTSGSHCGYGGWLDIPDETAARGIAAMGCVPGRMERIDLGQDFTAIVDFAHTPNALLRALDGEADGARAHPGCIWVSRAARPPETAHDGGSFHKNGPT